MDKNIPTIKGIFIKSHIKALFKQKGEKGIQELEKKYGKPLKFKNSENVPVREEVKIIEFVLDIISDKPVPPEKRAFEAGKLHFKNFATTPLGIIILSVFKNNFKTLMMNAAKIAGHVFQGVIFMSEDTGANSIKVVMENNDYPLDHFKGLFWAWMEYSQYKNIRIDAKETEPNTYEYSVQWEE